MLSETRAIRTRGKATATFYMVLFWKENFFKNLKWLLCSNFILPHGDISVAQMTVVYWEVKAHMLNFIHVLLPNKEWWTLCKTDAKIDEEIIDVRCVLLEVYRRTLKERHSIRIWSWEIRRGLKWINAFAVEWWPPAKETGISNVSSSGHQGWVVSLVSEFFKAGDSSQ